MGSSTNKFPVLAMASSLTYSISQFTVIFLLFLFSSYWSIASTSTTNSPPFKTIYAFGDSFTDTGNTKSITGPSGFGHVSSLPYGMTFFHHPTNRYSDGRLVIDFVTESLSLPFLQPYLHLKDVNASSSSFNGVNFAVAGSTSINHAFFVYNNLSLDVTPQSIQTQYIWFNKFLENQGCGGEDDDECKTLFDDALFWVGEIGVNDYAYTLGSQVSSDTIRALSIGTFTQFLQALLKKGAKYVVIQGHPPTGCLPLAMSLAAEDDRDAMGCVQSVNNQSYTHNIAFQTKLLELRTEFPQAVILYADYWKAYTAVMDDPEKYGFTERFKACCGSGTPPYNFEVFAVCGMPSARACSNPSQYINWDGVHLTEGMYKVMADMFLHGNFSQPPFSYLLDMKQTHG